MNVRPTQGLPRPHKTPPTRERTTVHSKEPRESFCRLDWPEPDTRSWSLFRAEGLPFSEAATSALGYVRKYIQKKWTAPAEMKNHFEGQKDWFRYFQAQDSDENKPVLKASLVGDIMWIRDSWDNFLSPSLLGQLNQSDVVLGNLETPITPRASVPSLLPDAKNFNAPPELITSFEREDGNNTFTALALANNHTYDQGVEGAKDTLSFLENQGVRTSGFQNPGDKKYTSFEKNGVHFGFYAATWGLNDPSQEKGGELDLNLLEGLTPVRVGERPSDDVNLDDIKAVLAQMEAEGIEQKVIALHWGHEFEMYPTDSQMNVAREIVCAGADIILGSHSHVVQPSEILFVDGYEDKLSGEHPEVPEEMRVQTKAGKPRKALVVYSAGNFTTNMYTTQCQVGAVQDLEYHRDPKTGTLDWDDPNLNLVFNDRGGLFSSRKLSGLEDSVLDSVQKAEIARLKKNLPGLVS